MKDATMRYVAKSKGRNPPTIDGLPLVKPPYERVTALNLNTGELAWMAPNGDGPRTHPLRHHRGADDLHERGKQYIVVAVGDRNMEPEFVALALQ